MYFDKVYQAWQVWLALSIMLNLLAYRYRSAFFEKTPLNLRCQLVDGRVMLSSSRSGAHTDGDKASKSTVKTEQHYLVSNKSQISLFGCMLVLEQASSSQINDASPECRLFIFKHQLSSAQWAYLSFLINSRY